MGTKKVPRSSELLELRTQTELQAQELAQARERLQSQQGLLEAMMDSNPAGLAVATGPDFIVQRVNAAFRRLSAPAGTDPLGQKLVDIWPAGPGSDEFAQALQQAVANGQVVPGPAGAYSIQKINWEGQVGVLAILWEAPPSGPALEALRKSEGEFRAIFELAAVGNLEIESKTGRLLRANRKFCQLSGYSKEELLEMTIQEVTFSDDWEVTHQVFQQLGSGERTEIEYEKRYQCKDGTHFWANVAVTALKAPDGSIQTHFAVIQDISEQKRLEAENQRQQESLRRANRRLEAVLLALPLAVWIADREGRMVQKNAMVDLLWGGNAPLAPSIDEFGVYRGWWADSGEPLKPEDWALSRALKTGQVSTGEVIDILRFDGLSTTILNSAAPIFNAEGEIDGAVAVAQDITHQRMLEQEARQRALEDRQRAARHLRQAAEMEAVFNAMTDSVLVFDAQGIPRQANPSVIQDYGYNPVGVDRAINLQHINFRSMDGQPLSFDQVPSSRALRGETIQGERLLARKRSGEDFVALVSASPFYIDQVLGGAVVVWQDITENQRLMVENERQQALLTEQSRQLERALAESRASRDQLEQILESIKDVFFAIDRDWRYTYANRRAAELSGVSPEALIGMELWEVWPSWRGTPIETYLRQALEHGEQSEFRLRSPEQSRWFDVNIYPAQEGVAVFFVDRTEMVQAEQALQESEERFRRAIMAAPFPISIQNEDGEFIALNDAWLQISGYAPEEIPNLETWVRKAYGDQAQRILPELLEYHDLNRRVSEGEYTVITRSGEQRVWDFSMAPLGIDSLGRRLFISIAMDITERKAVEATLRGLSERMQQYLDSNIVGMVFGNSSGEIFEANDYFLDLLGCTRQDLEAGLVRWNERTPPEHAAADEWALTEMRRWGTCTPYEKEYLQADGGRVWVLVSASMLPNGDLMGFVINIADRKAAEQAILEREARFRQLADAMPQLVWTARPDGTMEYFNQRYREYVGIIPVSETTWNWGEAIHPDDLETSEQAWQISVSSGEPYQMEHRMRLVNGQYHWHLARAVPVKNERGRIERWYGTSTDIQYQKEVEGILKGYAERLERSNRDLEDFAFVASHDLQEPLRKIEVFGDRLLRSPQNLSDQQREYLERMRQAAVRMRQMIDGLLVLSRLNTRARPFTQVDLSEVLGEVLSDLEIRIQHSGGRVEADTLPQVQGDRLQLRLLLQNLIGNALKFHEPEEPPRVSITAHALDRYRVQIIVTDNGIGFDPDDADRIFQPFQRLVPRSRFEGSGMGLAICRRIVERHGGSLQAESQPGQGSRFIITLPVGGR